MKTICLIAHDQFTASSSQQFLVTSGQIFTDVEFVDINSEWTQAEGFDGTREIKRLSHYDRIVFQFPLYWYQAPAILKIWFDQTFSDQTNLEWAKSHLREKQFGLVVVAGSGRNKYQRGGAAGVTISELVSPYLAWANYFDLEFIPPFVLYQFHYLSEKEKQALILDYVCYLLNGKLASLEDRYSFIFNQLKQLNLSLSSLDQMVFDDFVKELEDKQAELQEFRLLD